ncbi:MAG: FtsW/RodA/SpoVE family cell cycle protein [Lachnospiraceae bacterium]|nr:FtsW/RodA/SpoVE family cell cycle protein [Lachnospiraceae bacterium]
MPKRPQVTEEKVRPAAEKTAGYVDYSLILIVFFLAVFGLIMLFSTSSFEAGMKFGDTAFYLKRQMAATAFGIGVMFLLSFFPHYRVLKHLAIPAYLFAAVLIALVMTDLGYEANGARRWLQVGPISVQPAEVAKLAMIVFLAALITAMRNKAKSWKGFLFCFFMSLPIVAMIYKITENLSSAIIVLGIAMIMLFVATPGYKRFVGIAAVGCTAVFGVIYYILHYADPSHSVRFARIFAWSDLEAYASGKGYQPLQALYAIGSGGIFGKGLGQSIQKTGFIPEVQNDMIFSIICEELGLFGGIAVLVMFFLLLWRLVIIASNTEDLFGSLLVVGVMAHIAIQVILNIAVVTSLIPNTGITLPFISYGGSAIVMQLAEVGIVMNVARRIRT